MQNALVIGASGGIGQALVAELGRRDVAVTTLSRSADGFDVTDEASIEAGLAPLEGPFDLIFVASGALVIDGWGPEKALKHLTPEAMLDQFRTNAMGPALVLKHAQRLLARDARSVFAALSARVGSIGDNGLGGWYSYRTSKAALNQLLHGAAVELGRSHKKLVVACLHPGTVQTDFTADFPGHDKVTADVAAARLIDVIAGLDPAQSGGFFDYAGKEIPLVTRLVLILGDQLSPGLAALKDADRDEDVVVMAEVADEAGYVPHHPKKIALIFAAMRKFAAELRADGWTVAYTRLDDADNAGSIDGEVLRRAEEHSAQEVIVTEPGEWRLIQLLEDMPLRVRQLQDDRFLATHGEFEDWAQDRKTLRMEYFYRDMRRKTGLLMEGDDPVGGKWNFDHDNRKPAPDEVTFNGPMQFTPDDTVQEVLDLVEARFGNSFGDLHPFWFATDRGQARRALTHWIKGALPKFGDYQDAMLTGQRFLYHSVIGLYINVGLLDSLEVCQAAEDAYDAGDAPINAVEGFIRQIIGWREFMRGIYFLHGPDYVRRNALNHQRKLPGFFWDETKTKMTCLSQAIEQTRAEAYAHHIQRLMITGNFALLAGIDPTEVQEWYLAVYADAFEWVEAPNVVGMSQFADGGVFASKPYVSSGNYIAKMSDYCDNCAYKVKKKTGEGACPFNLLYWSFMDRHRDRFSKNPRMAQMYGTWDRMAEDKRTTILAESEAFLDAMSAGERV